MARDHRKVGEEPVQGVLLNDPGFLKEIVERMLRQVLEAQMTKHLGAARYQRSASRKGHRNGYKSPARSRPG
jgi:transposase-like protein